VALLEALFYALEFGFVAAVEEDIEALSEKLAGEFEAYAVAGAGCESPG